MNYSEESLKKHFEWKGKLEVTSRAKVENKQDLSLAYTPGVAARRGNSRSIGEGHVVLVLDFG